MFRLIIDTLPNNPVLLPADLSISIGRGDACDVQLLNPSASRVHCRVIVKNGRVTLLDEGSRWGTLVNGLRVSECDLWPGDRIQIGDTSLQLVSDVDANHSTLARRSELVRSAGLTAWKRHPNIVELLNAGRWNGWFFTASESVEGISAVDRIRKIGILGMMPTDRVLQIAIDLCQSLRFAEDHGIVHRTLIV